MRMMISAISAALLLASMAMAADLPAKAASPNPFQYPQASGFYYGIGTAGAAGSASVSSTTPGVNPSSVVTDQIGIYGIIGYAWNVSNTSMFTAAEGWFGWTNFNGTAPGFSFSGPAAFKQRFLVGAPTDQILALFPNIFGTLTPPPFTPPAGQTISSTRGYIAGALNEDNISANFVGVGSKQVYAFAPEFDVGVLAQLSGGTAIDAYGFVKFGDRAVCVNAPGGGCGALTTTYGAAMALKW
jgi:hypothetical protein